MPKIILFLPVPVLSISPFFVDLPNSKRPLSHSKFCFNCGFTHDDQEPDFIVYVRLHDFQIKTFDGSKPDKEFLDFLNSFFQKKVDVSKISA
jgi:hypothetical protein